MIVGGGAQQIIVSLLLWVCTWLALCASDVDICSARIVDYYTGQGAERAHPLMQRSLQQLNTTVEEYIGKLDEDGSWPDIDYAQQSMNAWTPLNHYRRLRAMAQGYCCKGQSFYQDKALLAQITQALTFIQSKISTAQDIKHWWYLNIGVPHEYGPTLLLLRGHIDEALFQEALTSLNAFTRRCQGAGAANNMKFAISQLYRLLLKGNEKGISNVKKVLDKYLVQKPIGDGIQEDGSFHSHGALVYMGGYGESFARSASTYCFFTAGTAFQPDQEKLDVLMEYVAEGIVWTIYHQWFDPVVEGRGLTRKLNNAEQALTTILLFANTPGRFQGRFIAVSKEIIKVKDSFSVMQAANAVRVADSPIAAAWPSGHKHFNCSDLTVHRRQDSYFSVHMFSNRTICGDKANKEGNKLWNLYDGNTYIALSGDEYYRDNRLPTLNWLRLSGTSAEQRDYKSSWKRYYCKGFRAFVGGASDDQNGVSAMDFVDVEMGQKASDPMAKKSWFFFDNDIVCLGSGIRCERNNPLETIVNQRPLDQADAPLYVNGRKQEHTVGWKLRSGDVRSAWCDSIGYTFPSGGTVLIDRSLQEGTWKNLNGPANTDTTVYKTPYITLAMPHQTPISDGRYAYTIHLNAAQEDMKTLVETLPYKVIQHDATVHAVAHTPTQSQGMVFWQAGSCGSFRVDRPCIIYAAQNDKIHTIALSEPTHGEDAVTVVYNRKLKALAVPEAVTVTTQGDQTMLTFNVKLGRNYICTFSGE